MAVEYFQEESFIRSSGSRHYRGLIAGSMLNSSSARREVLVWLSLTIERIRLVNVSRWPKAQDRWYLGVRCRKCRTPILFALDRTEGVGGDQPVLAGKLVLTCTLDTCRYQADYTAAAVTRFRKQADKPGDTGRISESPKAGKPKRRP